MVKTSWSIGHLSWGPIKALRPMPEPGNGGRYDCFGYEMARALVKEESQWLRTHVEVLELYK